MVDILKKDDIVVISDESSPPCATPPCSRASSSDNFSEVDLDQDSRDEDSEEGFGRESTNGKKTSGEKRRPRRNLTKLRFKPKNDYGEEYIYTFKSTFLLR